MKYLCTAPNNRELPNGYAVFNAIKTTHCQAGGGTVAGAVVDIRLHITEAVKGEVADETSISKVGVER